jgi:hypothetical protein
MMRKYHVPFWRATALVRESLTLILKKEAVRLTVLACALDSADTSRELAGRKSWLLLALVSFFVSEQDIMVKARYKNPQIKNI